MTRGSAPKGAPLTTGKSDRVKPTPDFGRAARFMPAFEANAAFLADYRKHCAGREQCRRKALDEIAAFETHHASCDCGQR